MAGDCTCLWAEYNHTLDTKGRLIIPSKFRETLGEKSVVTKGLDGCLFVYDNAGWTAFEEKLQAMPISRKDTRMFVRHFLAGAAEVEVDKQGRALIPSKLREFAELTKDVVLVGAQDILKSGARGAGCPGRKRRRNPWRISQSAWTTSDCNEERKNRWNLHIHPSCWRRQLKDLQSNRTASMWTAHWAGAGHSSHIAARLRTGRADRYRPGCRGDRSGDKTAGAVAGAM